MSIDDYTIDYIDKYINEDSTRFQVNDITNNLSPEHIAY